jgi:hypothetical protein
VALTDRSTGGNMYDDVALHDPQLLEEIELLGDLIVIATRTEHHLTLGEIDTALGLPVQSRSDHQVVKTA